MLVDKDFALFHHSISTIFLKVEFVGVIGELAIVGDITHFLTTIYLKLLVFHFSTFCYCRLFPLSRIPSFVPTSCQGYEFSLCNCCSLSLYHPLSMFHNCNCMSKHEKDSCIFEVILFMQTCFSSSNNIDWRIEE